MNRPTLARLSLSLVVAGCAWCTLAQAVEDTTQPESPPAVAAADGASTASPHASTARASSDRATTHAVRHALATTTGLDPAHIFVKSRHGVVYLTGFCPSEHQVNLAVRAARNAAGGSMVRNQLTIRSPN